MSQAFVREQEDNGLLHQIEPTIPALIKYLKAENNFANIFLKQTNKIKGVDIVTMSNGFSYFIDKENNWEMYL